MTSSPTGNWVHLIHLPLLKQWLSVSTKAYPDFDGRLRTTKFSRLSKAFFCPRVVSWPIYVSCLSLLQKIKWSVNLSENWFIFCNELGGTMKLHVFFSFLVPTDLHRVGWHALTTNSGTIIIIASLDMWGCLWNCKYSLKLSIKGQ